MLEKVARSWNTKINFSRKAGECGSFSISKLLVEEPSFSNTITIFLMTSCGYVLSWTKISENICFFRDWSEIDGQEAHSVRILCELPYIFKCKLIIDLGLTYVQWCYSAGTHRNAVPVQIIFGVRHSGSFWENSY